MKRFELTQPPVFLLVLGIVALLINGTLPSMWQRSPDKVFSGQAIPQTKPQCYTNIITVSAEWTRVDIPYGWNLKDSWGNAPLDIRINGDPKRTYPLFRGYNKEMGTDVQFKEWRVNHDYLSVTAKVVCVFTKVL